MSKLNLETARVDGRSFEPMPAGTEVRLFMTIRPGGQGDDGLLKPSQKGDCLGLDAVFAVVGGPFDGRKIYAFMLMSGTTAGHETAAGISRGKLRAIWEGGHGLDPNAGSTPEGRERLANVELSQFNGIAFDAILGIEKGTPKTDGGVWPDKNVIEKVLRIGDKDYVKPEQSPPIPLDRAGYTVPRGAPATAPAAIAKPSWAT